MISTEAIKALRDETGAGIMDCKRALAESGGDTNKAREILRQQGLARAEKKSERVAQQGLVDCYIHGGGRIGVLVEVNCETDFVARTDEFKALVHEIAMQIAAANPQYVRATEIPEGAEGSPKELALYAQPYIRDESKTIEDLVKEAIAKVGENITVRRFFRFELGR